MNILVADDDASFRVVLSLISRGLYGTTRRILRVAALRQAADYLKKPAS